MALASVPWLPQTSLHAEVQVPPGAFAFGEDLGLVEVPALRPCFVEAAA